MRRYSRLDDQGPRIEILLPDRPGSVGVTATNNRLPVEAVLYVDALGNPVGLHLTGGNAHDLAGADALLPKMQAERRLPPRRSMLTSASLSRWQRPRKPQSFRPGRSGARPAPHLSPLKGAPSPHAMTRQHARSAPPSTWPQPPFGSIEDTLYPYEREQASRPSLTAASDSREEA